MTLLRCNGPHGENIEHPHHIEYHIHKATAERINNGLKPEGNIEIVNDFSTMEEAIQYFIKRINLKNEDKRIYFPPPSEQMEIFK